MTLTDTGPLVALGDLADPHRERIELALARLRGPLLTTEACLTEAAYLLNRAGGWQALNVMRGMIQSGMLTIFQADDDASLHAFSYMERFRDQPCDYADATILVAAEHTGIRQVFTIDRHFRAYRLADGVALDVIP